jgi:hypothetical protein
VVAHSCNLGTLEAEAGGWRVWGHPGLHSKTLLLKKQVRLSPWEPLVLILQCEKGKSYKKESDQSSQSPQEWTGTWSNERMHLKDASSRQHWLTKQWWSHPCLVQGEDFPCALSQNSQPPQHCWQASTEVFKGWVHCNTFVLMSCSPRCLLQFGFTPGTWPGKMLSTEVLGISSLCDVDDSWQINKVAAGQDLTSPVAGTVWVTRSMPTQVTLTGGALFLCNLMDLHVGVASGLGKFH